MKYNSKIGLKARNLIKLKSIIPIPNFITIDPELFLQIYNNFEISNELSPDRPDEIKIVSEEAIKKVHNIPSDILNIVIKEIIDAQLQEPLIIRSCASIEDQDIKYNILAGIFESIGPINGRKEIEQGILTVIKSLYSPKAIFQMLIMGISIKSVLMGIIIQEYIIGEYYGVVFSHNPLTGEKQLIIEYSEKPEGVTLGSGESKIIYGSDDFDTNNYNLNIQIISQIKKYINICLNLLNHPIDMEFVIKNNELYILQVRELILHSQNKKDEKIDKSFLNIAEGIVSSPGFCIGIGKYIDSYSEEIIERAKDNEIILSEVLDLGILPWIANAKGFCTIASGFASHASIIARQMRKPMLTALNISRDQLRLLDEKKFILNATASKGYILSTNEIKDLINKERELDFYFLNWTLSDLFSYRLDNIKSIIFKKNHLLLFEKPEEVIIFCDLEESTHLIDPIKIYFKSLYSNKIIKFGYIDEYYEIWPVIVIYRSNKEDFKLLGIIKELFEELKFDEIKSKIQKLKNEINKLHINLQNKITLSSFDQMNNLQFLYDIIQQIRLKSTTLTAINRILFDFGDRSLSEILKHKFEDPAIILSQLEQGIPLKSMGIQEPSSFLVLEFYLKLTKLKNSMEIRFDEDKLNQYNIIYDKIQKLSKLYRKDFGAWDIILFKISKSLNIKNYIFDFEYNE
ncbi:MAG: hypothetical protein JXA99_11095 [Candidatus Lokiarchaeota archaeon]|nr:hypothetical protein [Candidatus Lokiarchaeota archaeon]